MYESSGSVEPSGEKAAGEKLHVSVPLTLSCNISSYNNKKPTTTRSAALTTRNFIW
jgi:hypothetical protein